MLETLATVGKAAAGLGSLASGLGLGGAKGDGFDRSEQAAWLKDQHDIDLHYKPKHIEAEIRHKVDQTMKAAKEQGVHPMYLLGNAPSANSPSFSGFSSGGSGSAGKDYAQAGRGLGKALGSIASSKFDKEMQDLGLRQARAETQKSEYGAYADYLELRKLQQEANANQESAVTYAAKPTPKQEKTLLSKGRGGGTTDVTGMEKVDPWNEYFGELGELEQSLRNYYQRYKRELLRRRDVMRERNKHLKYRSGGNY